MSPAIITLLGGSALLVYSIEELSKSVQYLVGKKLKSWINTYAEHKISGVILGILLSIVLTSSGAVTVMLVGLANSRMLSIEQVFLLTLGASIGSTFIVHLFAFNVADYGLLMIAIGVGIASLGKSDRTIRLGRAVLFLGMMFYSMSLVVLAGKTLETNELFQYVIRYFQDRPIVSLFISTALTAVIHSSAATIAFIMSMIAVRHGNVYEAIPWVLGANLGTTTTAFFASYKSGILGKQADAGNFLCKFTGVILCYPLMQYLGRWAEYIGGDVSRQIANAHTLFNVILTVLFLPFISYGVAIVRKFYPDDEKDEQFTYKYLDPRTLESPELALAQAQREILRLSDVVEQMVERSIYLFKESDDQGIDKLKAMDQVVDFLNKGIKLYLTKLSQKEMSPEQIQKEFELLIRTNDLENIGDIIDKNILELVRKNVKKGYVFSKEGWLEIVSFHQKVMECLKLSTAYFSTNDRGLKAKLILLHQKIEDMSIGLSEAHVQRLHMGVKESLNTTSVHLDLLGNLQRIATLSVGFMRVASAKSSNEELTG